MKVLTWSEVWVRAQRVADMVREERYDYILAVPRGGLVPASMVAYLTGLPVSCGIPRAGQVALAIDDLVETGKTKDDTMLALSRFAPGAPHRFVTLFDKDPRGEWLVFPWEDATQAATDEADYQRRRAL